VLPCSGSEDDRGQLAECLAFISDIALTGDADTGHRVDLESADVVPATCSQYTSAAQDDDEAGKEATGDQVQDEAPIPETTNYRGSSGGRLRHRLQRLRFQRQRSAPGRAMHSAASVDDSVNSHIEMLNSLDSQVSEAEHWSQSRTLHYRNIS